MDFNDLHDRAMENTGEADTAYRLGEFRTAKAFYGLAYSQELMAAQRTLTEPMRSTMYFCAAVLALAAGLYSEAVSAARISLEGELPDSVRQELQKFIDKTLSYMGQEHEG